MSLIHSFIGGQPWKKETNITCVLRGKHEVEREVYLTYYKFDRHERYLNEKDKNHNVQLCDNTQLELAASSGQLADSVNNPEDQLLRKQEYCQLYCALETLSETERSMIFALYFGGETEAGLSKAFGISQSAVHYRKERILKKLRNILNKWSRSNPSVIVRKWFPARCSMDSTEAKAMWGVTMVLGQFSRGWSVGRGGYVSKTSQAAPAISLFSSASASAAESRTPPRAVLMRMALFSSGRAAPCRSCPSYPPSGGSGGTRCLPVSAVPPGVPAHR